ncbi:hypothetical protein FOCC_FOCC005419 [Frankliniella occidentalis]|uniref:NEDD4-binding protein 1 n=1 Tax=Frankliniella occidentalis TaxID=133901 RepID=A0A6J1RXL4_FRAOC|nr:NEDD4-binding protein 1 [Frankliniella occidentalis]XP_026273703.1 NEDD4-binding protein 1 [Frankliniella occidentalis]KAE8747808.1 hypothetical protein FOCC_FOCC005419 [Frankliniella occidentalis]
MMVNFSPTSKCSNEDKGLLHTGMYLRPSIAASLQRIIRNKLIQERAQFTVAKSQVHPNGLCEIVVKKFSPNVSTVKIMEMLQQCRECVQDSSPSHNGDSDVNKTIDLSDGDDSVCILSPTHSALSLRKSLSTPKRPSFSPISSISSIKMDSGKQSVNGIASLTGAASSPHVSYYTGSDQESENQSIYSMKTLVSSFISPNSDDTEEPPDTRLLADPLEIKETSPGKINHMSIVRLPSESENQRMGTLKRTSPEDIHSTSLVKKPNLSEDVTSAVASLPEESNSSVLILDITVDTLPSAPTLATSRETSLSKVQVSRNVIEQNLLQPNTSGAALKNTSNSKSDSKPLYSHVLTRDQTILPTPSTSKMPVEILDLSEDNPSDSNNIGNKISSSSGSAENVKAVGSETSLDQNTQSTKDLCHKDVWSSVHSDVPIEITDSATHSTKTVSNQASTSSESSTGDSSSEESLDEIIIEKEVQNDHKNLNHTVLIDDSDDDILVCEVLPTANKQVGKVKNMKKGKQKKNFNQNKIPAGSVFVASTSRESAEDFIPLKPSYRRIDPRSNFYEDKQSRLKKIQQKKLKKSQVMKKRSLTGNCAPTRPKESPSKGNKKKGEKHEYDGNIMNPNSGEPKAGLRPIVIDASNVAVGHGRGKFSVPGLQICIKYFTDRGHKVHAFAPKYRRFQVSPEERQILDNLETEGILSFTPSRTLQSGKKVASYDDRFIVQTAAELGGVVVSTDNFRDLLEENEAWRDTIEKRLLMFTWVQDMLLFPNDPLGRHGPHLSEFLRFPNQPVSQAENQPSTSSSA